MAINSLQGVRGPVRLHTKRSFQEAHYRIDKNNYFEQKLQKEKQKNEQKSKGAEGDFKYIADKFQKIRHTGISSNQKPKDNEFNNILKKVNFNRNTAKDTAKTKVFMPMLNLTNKNQFTFKTKSGNSILLKSDGGTICMEGYKEKLSDEDIKESDNICDFLTSLNHDEKYLQPNDKYSKEEIKDMLNSIDIKPGFFKLKRKSGDKEFLMRNNGSIYTNNQVEADRYYYNNMDLVKNAGFTKDATCEIDGKIYKIEESGHFNIPKGVRCIKENMIIKK